MRPVPVAAQGPARLPKGFRTVHDLTHPFSPALPLFPAFTPVQIRQKFTIAKDGFFANEITFDEHTGTHVDAPIHFVADAAAVDQLAPDRLVARSPLSRFRRALRETQTPWSPWMIATQSHSS